jgi:ectoine hydroxylase-related dioxygenase (phytanoyl-CoA dioxygenase family)
MLANRFAEDGFVSPLRVLPAGEAAALAARLDALFDAPPTAVALPWLYKTHLLFTWMDALVRRPEIVDAVSQILGPDVLMFDADVWRKAPGETRHISWHQDAKYWSLAPMDVATVWIALTPATPENGCLRFARGSHRDGKRDHVETRAGDNMLSRGQTIFGIDPDTIVTAPLAAGEASIHHGLTAHGSGPNTTVAPRIGVAAKYLSARARQAEGPPWSGILVAGRDHGHFALETSPAADLSPEAIAEHHRRMAPHAPTGFIHM